MSRKKIIITAFICIIIIGALALLAFSTSNQKNSSAGSAKVVNEPQGPGIIIIDNTDALSTILLSKQYEVTYNAVAAYIQGQIAGSVQHAMIVDKPIVADNGEVVFSVKTFNPNKQFTVHIDRLTYFDRIIFSVQGTDYQKIIPTYTSNTDE
jgi:hypothetical protein